MTPRCGTSSAAVRVPRVSCARTNMPGSSSRFGFGNTARSTTEPVHGSTDTSETLSRPRSAYTLPSSSVSPTSASLSSVFTSSPLRELALQAQHLGATTA